MDHATGKSWVTPRKLHYHDALAPIKRVTVIAAVMESTGGICGRLRSACRRLRGSGSGYGW